MSNYVVQSTNLCKTFQDGTLCVEVLRDVNFKVAKGERIAIVGSSGSGKSTLLHLLGGLDLPSKGEVIVANQSIAGLSEKKRGILRNKTLGFVYQFHHLLPEFTALENVAIPLLLRHESPSFAREAATLMLTRVGLSKRLAHKPGELSGGERQRAAIARALVTQPQCVLADEPTGNLDNRTSAQIYEVMLALNQEFGTSFVVVTHDTSLAARMNKIYTLVDGELSAAESQGN